MKFEIYVAEDGWRWAIVARNGKNIAHGGESYQRPQKLLQSLKRYIVRDDPVLMASLEKALELEGMDIMGNKLK